MADTAEHRSHRVGLAAIRRRVADGAAVVSPSTEKYDRTDKLAVYRAHGVEWVWLVDPLQRTLEILRRHEDGWILSGAWRDDATVRAPPFDAIELSLEVLWADVVLPPG